MSATPPPSSSPDVLPPRPVTIHTADRCSVAFEGYGTVEITGPRRGELAGMVSALPLVLRALASVSVALRGGTAMPDLFELETALVEAGITPGSLPAVAEDPAPAMPTPLSDRLAGLLASVAVKLGGLLTDRANFRAPRGVKDALQETVGTIQQTLRDTGYGALLPADSPTDAAEPPA